jgi:Metallo-beta-lactamase superfamily
MALEIKVLDYGDIELEASFLVLGRDCGRGRRAPVFGMLILGGTWPILVDTGYRSNQIMETLGMRGLQSHETMIENQLKKHGLRLGDVRYVLHTHLHIDHAGKDDLFPMNTTVVLNRRELEYSVSGLMHPQYPAIDIKHLIDRLQHQERAALPRSRNHWACRIDAGRDLRSGRRPHRRLDEHHRQHRRRRCHDLRRRNLRLQRSDHRAILRDQRHGAARYWQSLHH